MQVARFLRFYNIEGQLFFEAKLPTDCFNFLSTLDFLLNEDDPLLYYCYQLEKDQCILIATSLASDSFDISEIISLCSDKSSLSICLDCDRLDEDHTKTKEEVTDLFKHWLTMNLDWVISDLTSDLKPIVNPKYLEGFNKMLYKAYQQGVIDGRL